MSRKLPDNFFLGMAAGGGLLILLLQLIEGIRDDYAEHAMPGFLREPRPELAALVINILLFRLLMVNFSYEKTGRGVLFSTVLLVMLYSYTKFRHFAP